MKKILLFTMSPIQSRYEAGRVKEEAKKKGIVLEQRIYRELNFEFKNNGQSKVFLGGEEINKENTRSIWFRVAGTKSGKYIAGRNNLIRMMQSQGVFCVNSGGYLAWDRMGKVEQHGVYVNNDIPVVETRIFFTKEQFFGAKWEYPVVGKHTRGYQGKSVKKFNNEKELFDFVERMDEINLGMFLWQKCLPTKWDIRVIVIDGKAIGGMKRSVKGDEFRSNFSLGGEVNKWELNDEERILAERVANVCGLDYCGVDIMKDEEGNNYILEVNRACQFQGFEKSTGINVAELVLEMLEK